MQHTYKIIIFIKVWITMTTKIFNPAMFAPPEEKNDQTQEASHSEQKCYPLTGNSSRDSNRKLLFEIFSLDDADAQCKAELIEALENQISKDCPDPKSRQYRDTSRALQNKLKGSRFTELRLSLLKGEISVQDACSEDFLSGKTTPKPSTGPRSGSIAGSNPARPGFPRGAPGQAVKPRGAPPGQIFRPPGMNVQKPMMPVRPSAPLMPEIPRVSQEDDNAPSDLQIEEQNLNQGHHEVENQSQTRLEQIPSQQIMQINPVAPLIEPQTHSVQEETKTTNNQDFTQPSNQQTLQIEEPQTPNFDRKNIEYPQRQTHHTLDQSVDVSYEVSQDQIGQSSLPPSGKATKKGKKKKKKTISQSEHEVDEGIINLTETPSENQGASAHEIIGSTSEQAQQISIPETQILVTNHLPDEKSGQKNKEFFRKQDSQQQQSPQKVVEEETKQLPAIVFEQKSKSITQQKIQQERKEYISQSNTFQSIPQQAIPPIQSVAFLSPQQVSTPKRASIEQSQPKYYETANEQKIDALFNENLRLRQQLRHQNQLEESNLAQQHQIQLLHAQLKGRDEQLIALRWQMQQSQIQQQREIDELKQRIKRTHQESQLFRELMSQQRLQNQVTHNNEHQQQFSTHRQNQYQQMQPTLIRNDEMTADRGSNFLGVRNFQHGGNEVNSIEAMEANLESGEADEGGRDDGHFYRNTTADEGTGGAGESYQQQQRIIDVSSSGSGQILSNTTGGYQRFEQAYGVMSNEVQQINEDDYDDEEIYQTQVFGQPDQNVVPQSYQLHRAAQQQQLVQNSRIKESSSGSAFGEGNQQDDSEDEGMGMGMGNRQGSGHDVEDESGSLDVVAQNSGQQMLQKNFNFQFGTKTMIESDPLQIINNPNHQNEVQEAQQHVNIGELDDDQEGEQHSLGEEGGCRSNGGEEMNEVDMNLNVHEINVLDQEGYENQLNRQNQQQEIVGSRDQDSNHSMIEADDEDNHSHYNSNTQNAQFYSSVYSQMAEEEEKEDPNGFLINPGGQQQQRLNGVISDNVERPQPYHPRQQQRPNTQQVTVSSGGAAVLTTQGSLMYPLQNTYMQGESIVGGNPYNPFSQQERSSGVAQILKQSMGGVAVVRPQRDLAGPTPNQNIPQKNISTATPSDIQQLIQAGERPGAPGQHQRRGNKQQFQVPPLPPTTTNSSNQIGGGSTKGQGQGGGVVGQNQSSSQNRNGRNSRGTQRNNLQQQVFATTPNTGLSQQTQQTNSEQNSPRMQQALRPPASQASSAAQLPISQQNAQASAGGATGGLQQSSSSNYRGLQQISSSSVQNDQFQELETTQQQQHSQQLYSGLSNNQQTNSSQTSGGVYLQASTMPASQASVSGSGGQQQRQQSHNGSGPSDRLSHPYNQIQSAQPAIGGNNHGARLEGVVHPPGSQQLNQYTSHNMTPQNTQALGGAMMGSSGSALLIGGDMGGLTDRNNRNSLNQMNAESGSTTEFTGSQRNFPPYLGAGGSNAMQTSQAYQQVSSPPSTSNHIRQSTYPLQHQFQSSQQSHQHEQEGASASGGGEADLFVASVGATPLAQNSRGAISSAHPPLSMQQQNTNQLYGRQQNNFSFSQQQQSYYRENLNQQKVSGSGESATLLDLPVNQLLQSQNASSGGAAIGGQNTNQGESGANSQMLQSRSTFQSQQQLMQQQSHTDSRKTSGANTPSKDGADTPPYRDQMQNNSYILNLTSKRLLQLQQNNRTTAQVPQSATEQLDMTEDLFNNREQQHQQITLGTGQTSQQRMPPKPPSTENKVIPRNMFE